MAEASLDHIHKMAEYSQTYFDKTVNQEVDDLLNDVQYNIMKIAITKELEG